MRLPKFLWISKNFLKCGSFSNKTDQICNFKTLLKKKIWFITTRSPLKQNTCVLCCFKTLCDCICLLNNIQQRSLNGIDFTSTFDQTLRIRILKRGLENKFNVMFFLVYESNKFVVHKWILDIDLFASKIDLRSVFGKALR